MRNSKHICLVGIYQIRFWYSVYFREGEVVLTEILPKTGDPGKKVEKISPRQAGCRGLYSLLYVCSFLPLFYAFGKYGDLIAEDLHNASGNIDDLFPLTCSDNDFPVFQGGYNRGVVFQYFKSTRGAGDRYGSDVTFENRLVWSYDVKSHV